jgi:hypothetical protein
MRDEIKARSKTDVLDFVISFIVEHEKRMDIITERLGKKRYSVRNTGSPVKIENPEPGTFTITIHNPEDFEPIKSVRIDWKDTEKIFHPDDLELDSILHDIEYTLKDDGRDCPRPEPNHFYSQPQDWPIRLECAVLPERIYLLLG